MKSYGSLRVIDRVGRVVLLAGLRRRFQIARTDACLYGKRPVTQVAGLDSTMQQ